MVHLSAMMAALPMRMTPGKTWPDLPPYTNVIVGWLEDVCCGLENLPAKGSSFGGWAGTSVRIDVSLQVSSSFRTIYKVLVYRSGILLFCQLLAAFQIYRLNIHCRGHGLIVRYARCAVELASGRVLLACSLSGGPQTTPRWCSDRSRGSSGEPRWMTSS